MMSNENQLIRSRLVLRIGFLSLILIGSPFTRYSANGNVVEDTGKRAYRIPSTMDFDLDTKPPKPWDVNYSPNPCYEDHGKLICGPSFYLMGIQDSGLDLLRQAIGIHPSFDCYSTGFFSGFTDLKAIRRSDMEIYLHLFESSTQKIQRGTDQLLICDSGRDLARPYDLDENAGVLSAPEFTTAAALANLYHGMKVFVILRDPTTRFIREYCDLVTTTPFAKYVDDAIAEFIDCENNATREITSCVYDPSLSGLLQAGLYDFLIREDLDRSFGINSYKLLTGDHLINSATRRALMASVFDFLGKDVPSPHDPYWGALDSLFILESDYCHGRKITNTGKQKLRDFYRTRATIFADTLL